MAERATVVARQSFLRNVVSDEGFLNIYVFGIDPDLEQKVSKFSLSRGRFLRNDEGLGRVGQVPHSNGF